MEREEFEDAIRKDDFAIGESFWIDDWEFEVVSRRGGKLSCDEAVFKWELTREDFLQVIKDSHPEIKNPEEFFERNEDEIVHYFGKGFDSLICECGVSYESVIRDAFEEVLRQNREAGL